MTRGWAPSHNRPLEAGDGAPLDWLDNRLEVYGPEEPFNDFVAAASGPGFVDWQPNTNDLFDYAVALMLNDGTRRPAAERAARRLIDRLWWGIEEARSRSERATHSMSLDLNALLPVPSDIRRTGYWPHGAQWCRANWGTPAPLKNVVFSLETRPLGDGPTIRSVAVYDFYSQDWSPWQALLAIRARWPKLIFTLTPIYDHAVCALAVQNGPLQTAIPQPTGRRHRESAVA